MRPTHAVSFAGHRMVIGSSGFDLALRRKEAPRRCSRAVPRAGALLEAPANQHRLPLADEPQVV